MSTMQGMSWAFDLRDILPVERLIAIYFAGRAGADSENSMAMEIVAHDAAEWCGCRKEDVDVGLTMLQSRGLQVTRIDDWVYYVRLEFPCEVKSEIRRGESTTYLYVIATKDAVKVGITTSPDTRFKGFKTAIPHEFVVHLCVPGRTSVIIKAEMKCHENLHEFRIRGEWFSCPLDHALGVLRAVLRDFGIEAP